MLRSLFSRHLPVQGRKHLEVRLRQFLPDYALFLKNILYLIADPGFLRLPLFLQLPIQFAVEQTLLFFERIILVVNPELSVLALRLRRFFLLVLEILDQIVFNLNRVSAVLVRDHLRQLVGMIAAGFLQPLFAVFRLRVAGTISPLPRNVTPREIHPLKTVARANLELRRSRDFRNPLNPCIVLHNPVHHLRFSPGLRILQIRIHRLDRASMRVRIRITAHSSLFQHPPVIRIRMIQHITHLAPHVRHHIRPVRIRILFNRKTDIRIIPVIRSNIVRGRLDLSRLKGNVNHITVLVFFYKTVIAGNLAYFCQNFTAAKGTVKLRQYICVVFAAVIDCIYRAVQCFCPPCRAGIPAIIFGIVCHIITGWINRIQYFAQLCFCNGKFIRIQRLLDREINFKKFSIFILITFRKTPVIGKVESAPVSLSVPVGKFITELRKIRR